MSYADLKGKTVLVTGGASGIGFAVAKAFEAARSHVVIVGRNRGKLERAGGQFDTPVRTIVFDLNNIDRLSELVAQAADAKGDIDVLVNCAGINLKKTCSCDVESRIRRHRANKPDFRVCADTGGGEIDGRSRRREHHHDQLDGVTVWNS